MIFKMRKAPIDLPTGADGADVLLTVAPVK